MNGSIGATIWVGHPPVIEKRSLLMQIQELRGFVFEVFKGD